MAELHFDSGVKEYLVNGNGVLRFNPSDPNVYNRFLDAQNKLTRIETDLVEKGKAIPEGGDGEAVIRILAEADRRAKEVLSEVFGGDNDFDDIMGGVNMMAVGGNGERVIANFIAAITPIMEEGAKSCASQKVAAARLNREQRRAEERQ